MSQYTECWLPFAYIVKYAIHCQIYDFQKIQNTNISVRVTQHISSQQPKSLGITYNATSSLISWVHAQNDPIQCVQTPLWIRTWLICLLYLFSITETVLILVAFCCPGHEPCHLKICFFNMILGTESHLICFVLTKLVLIFFLQQQLNWMLLLLMGRQITIKTWWHVHVLGRKMLLKLVQFQ